MSGLKRFMTFSLSDKHQINKMRVRMENMSPEKIVPLDAAIDAFEHDFDDTPILEKILDNL